MSIAIANTFHQSAIQKANHGVTGALKWILICTGLAVRVVGCEPLLRGSVFETLKLAGAVRWEAAILHFIFLLNHPGPEF
jgi:hypothetical protein